MLITGERLGAGSCQCNNCGQIVRIYDATDTLSPCSKYDNI